MGKNWIDKLHTTQLGVKRIAKNALVQDEDVVLWCKNIVASPEAVLTRKGKNWYVTAGGFVFTINASSYTVITVHKLKK